MTKQDKPTDEAARIRTAWELARLSFGPAVAELQLAADACKAAAAEPPTWDLLDQVAKRGAVRAARAAHRAFAAFGLAFEGDMARRAAGPLRTSAQQQGKTSNDCSAGADRALVITLRTQEQTVIVSAAPAADLLRRALETGSTLEDLARGALDGVAAAIRLRIDLGEGECVWRSGATPGPDLSPQSLCASCPGRVLLAQDDGVEDLLADLSREG